MKIESPDIWLALVGVVLVGFILLRKRILASKRWRWIAATFAACAIAPTILPGACGAALSPAWKEIPALWQEDPVILGGLVWLAIFFLIPVVVTTLILRSIIGIMCRIAMSKSAESKLVHH